MSKRFKGRLRSWKKLPHEAPGTLNYYVTGVFVDHPIFAGKYCYTSMVVAEKKGGWIETCNSRYRLVGPPSQP
jgi:hypothetical protein